MRDTVERISIPLVGDGNNSQTQHAVQTLRNAVIPQTIGAVFGTAVAVSGMTAGSSDFNNTSHVPLVFGLVLALVFLVMLVTFRSIMIPAKAVLLNLLSVLERLLVGQMAGRHHLVAASLYAAARRPSLAGGGAGVPPGAEVRKTGVPRGMRPCGCTARPRGCRLVPSAVTATGAMRQCVRG